MDRGYRPPAHRDVRAVPATVPLAGASAAPDCDQATGPNSERHGGTWLDSYQSNGNHFTEANRDELRTATSPCGRKRARIMAERLREVQNEAEKVEDRAKGV